MSSIQTIHRQIPQTAEPINIRPATMGDLAFIDQLQKKQTRQVGWMPTKQLEGKIAAGHVLIAEESVQCAVGSGQSESSPPTAHCPPPTLLGYLIGNDQYFKRDDLGIIYQMNVLPEKRRSFVAARLLKAQFDRSAYGCRLYCCWCAQDLEANKFWEAMGFVPLAYRAGSEKKGPNGTVRMHIFWQKRIRHGDVTTQWWFPSETKGGALMEDRLVFPIPPGTHWSDAKPVILPRDTQRQSLQLEEARPRKAHKPTVLQSVKRTPLSGGLQFAPAVESIKTEKPKREKKQKLKNDARFVAAARELRDRYLEQVNSEPMILDHGKYEVSRMTDTTMQAESIQAMPMKMLAA